MPTPRPAGPSRTPRRGGARSAWPSGSSSGSRSATSSRSGSTATGRRSSPSTTPGARPTRRSSGRTPGRRPEQAELAAATGLQGWSLAGLPAALWLERHRARGRRRDPLVPRDLGLRRAAPDRRRGDEPRRRASRSRTRRRSSAAGLPGRQGARRRSRPASVVGPLRDEAAAALGLRAGIPVVAGIVDALASFHGAGMTRAGDAMDPGGSAGGFGVYWDRPLVVPGSFSTIAPLPGLYSVGGAMAATGRAVDWFRVDVLGGAGHDRDPDRGGRRDPGRRRAASCSCRTSPGERSPLWDPTARGAFVGLGPGPRPGAPDPGDPRGVGVRDPPRRRADPRGRRRGPARCASAAARPGARRGTRSRPT